jgi:glycosyltransferase involved in cell wall biosynthesis
MPEQTKPLVSCIMPTYNRPHFVPHAVRYFLEQDYASKELIIVDDSPASYPFALPASDQIRYRHETRRRSLGEKRNSAIAASRGEIILHWDDDDWMARDRIARQVACLTAAGTEVCGLDRMLFYDSRSDQIWLYQYPDVQKRWLAGGSLCYWKTLWQTRNFKSITQGEDTHFLWTRPEPAMTAMRDFQFYVAVIHGTNTCTKTLSGPCWSRWQQIRFDELVGADRNVYRALMGRR